MREGRVGGRADEQALSLSLANACNPYCKRIPWRRITRAVFSPSCVPSRANPSGLGHAATILLVGPGTPRGRNADNFPHLIQALYIVYLFSKYLKYCSSIVVFLVLLS
jgi:hypothetical protein